MHQGCLVSGNDDYAVLVFPDNITSWNEQTQTLTVGDIQLKVGDVFSSNLVYQGIYADKPYLPLAKVADEMCLNEGQKMIYLGSILVVGD
ncbi:MAG: hypothetical protein Q4B81_02575 [Moraxella sp.]|nr:hypothetical protein [Moraxella sp.]